MWWGFRQPVAAARIMLGEARLRSARNVPQGGETTRVLIEVNGGALTASITNVAVEVLKLKEG
jgi:hypothetical protein